MVFCTEFLDGWLSWEPLRRSCARCGWCRANCWVISSLRLSGWVISSLRQADHSSREESYQVWCIVVCDLETSWMRRPWPTGGLLHQKQTNVVKRKMPCMLYLSRWERDILFHVTVSLTVRYLFILILYFPDHTVCLKYKHHSWEDSENVRSS